MTTDWKSASGTKTTLMVVLTLMLSALLVPGTGTGARADETGEITCFVGDVGGLRIDPSTVTLINSETGDTVVNHSKGTFHFKDLEGTYVLLAEAEGHYDAGEGRSGPITVGPGDSESVDLTLVKISTGSLTAFYNVTGTVINDTGALVKGADVFMVSAESHVNGYRTETVKTDENGSWEMEVYEGDYYIFVTAEGYLFNESFMKVPLTVNGPVTGVTVRVFPVPDSSPAANRIYGKVTAGSRGKAIDDVRAWLFDSNYGIFFNTEDVGYFEFKVYPGTFRLIVDSPGYDPYTDKIILTGNGKANLDVVLNETSTSKISTSVVFKGDDWNDITVKSVWTVNSDTVLHALEWGEVGDLRLAIDIDPHFAVNSNKTFGDGDGVITADQETAFNDWLSGYGPYHLDTSGFFSVKGGKAGEKSDFEKKSFKHVSSGLTGTGSVKLTETVGYGAVEDIGLNKSQYTLSVGELRESETVSVQLPIGYEVKAEDIDEDKMEVIPNEPSDGYVTVEITGKVTFDAVPQDPPSVDFEISANGEIYNDPENDTVIVAPDVNFTLDATGSTDNGRIVNYTWDIDGVINVTEDASKSINFTAPGPHHVGLTIIDNTGMTNESAVWTIYVDTEAPTAEFVVKNETNVTVLQFDEDTLLVFWALGSIDTVDTINPGWIVEWRWDFDHRDGYGVNEQGESVNWSFDDPGTYVVSLNLTDSVGNEGSINHTFTVNDITAPVPVLDGPSVVDVGEVFTINATLSYDDFIGNGKLDEGEDEGLTYSWDLDLETDSDGDGFPDNDADVEGPILEHSYAKTGGYDIMFNVSDANGNFKTKLHHIEVKGSRLIVEKLEASKRKVRTADSLHTKDAEKLTITVVINNTGQVASGEFLVHLYIDGKHKAKKAFDNLSAGMSVTWKKQMTFDEEGTHSIRVNVTSIDNDPVVPGDEQETSPFIMGKEVKVKATQPAPDSVYIYGIGVLTIGIVGIILWYFYYGPGSLKRSMKKSRAERKKKSDDEDEDED